MLLLLLLLLLLGEEDWNVASSEGGKGDDVDDDDADVGDSYVASVTVNCLLCLARKASITSRHGGQLWVREEARIV